MSNFLSVNQDELKKVGIKFVLVLLGFIATVLETDLLNIIQVQGWMLPLIVALNTALVDYIRKFIKNSEGKYLTTEDGKFLGVFQR